MIVKTIQTKSKSYTVSCKPKTRSSVMPIKRCKS